MKPLALFLFFSISCISAQTITFTYDIRGNMLTKSNEGHLTDTVQLGMKIILQGGYVSGAGLMRDSIRAKGYFPTTEPYTALGYVYENGGGENINPSLLSVTGNNALVDWVIVEARNAHNNEDVISSRAALLQRDGDIVDLDGLSPVKVAKTCEGEYYIVVRHRNHLSVMTGNRIGLKVGSVPNPVNLSLASTPTYGTNAQKDMGNGLRALWAGDATRDGAVRYNGAANDRVSILTAVGITTPNNIVNGYNLNDINLDGRVTYNGAANDRVVILLNVGFPTPNNVILEQLP
jgi:hypothetical protein